MRAPKKNNNLAVCLLLAVVVMGSRAIEVTVPKEKLTQSACPTPLIFESIANFKLPLDDVATLLQNQLSHNTLSNIAAPNKVYLTNIQYQSSLISPDQSESYPTPLSALVFNEKTQIVVDYKILITEGAIPKNKTFTAKTKISNIQIKYQKDYIVDNGSYVISNMTVKLAPEMMTTTYDQKLTDKQQSSFNAAILGNTSSLYATFAKLLSVDDLQRYMQTNCKSRPLSVVYKENPYNYKFDDGRNVTMTVPVDVATTWIDVSADQQMIVNGLSGMLPQGNKYCSSLVPDFSVHGGRLFITKEFLQNFVDYNVMAFSGWQNIMISKSTVRSTFMQWELLDLDFLVDGLWQDLWNVANNEIHFVCSVKENVDTQISENKGVKLHQTMKWACEGFVKLNQTAKQKVIQFSPTIEHITNVEVSTYGTITPYVNVLKMIDCQFSEVTSLSGQGVYRVNEKNMKLARMLMESVFNDLRVYTVGLRFWVGQSSRRVEMQEQGRGLWIL